MIQQSTTLIAHLFWMKACQFRTSSMGFWNNTCERNIGLLTLWFGFIHVPISIMIRLVIELFAVQGRKALTYYFCDALYSRWSSHSNWWNITQEDPEMKKKKIFHKANMKMDLGGFNHTKNQLTLTVFSSFLHSIMMAIM